MLPLFRLPPLLFFPGHTPDPRGQMMTSRKRSAIAHIDSDFGGECLLLHLLQYLAPCKPVQSAASIPARRSTLTSSMTLSFRREANALFSVLPLGLCCSNRRFVCVSQTT